MVKLKCGNHEFNINEKGMYENKLSKLFKYIVNVNDFIIEYPSFKDKSWKIIITSWSTYEYSEFYSVMPQEYNIIDDIENLENLNQLIRQKNNMEQIVKKLNEIVDISHECTKPVLEEIDNIFNRMNYIENTAKEIKEIIKEIKKKID